MTDLETRLAATMRAHDVDAPTSADVAVRLARRNTRLKRRAIGWLAAAAAACLIVAAGGVSAYVAGHRASPALTIGPSPVRDRHGDVEPVAKALVSADGRTITVPATGGGCVTGVRLSAIETPTEVRLDLSRSMSKGTVCTAETRLLQASAMLAQPLGTRTLVDQSTGREVAYIPGQDLAAPGWLPPGASSPRDSYTDGWTRTYTFPKASRIAPLQIIENPGRFANPDQFTDNRSNAVTVRVGDADGQLVVERATSGRVEEAFVGWVAGRYSIIVSSSPWTVGQRALSPAGVMRVARALRVPASRGAPAG